MPLCGVALFALFGVSIGFACSFGWHVSVALSVGLEFSSFAWFVGDCVGAESSCSVVMVAVSFGSWILSSSSDYVVAKSSSLRKGVNNLALSYSKFIPSLLQLGTPLYVLCHGCPRMTGVFAFPGFMT